MILNTVIYSAENKWGLSDFPITDIAVKSIKNSPKQNLSIYT